MFFEDEHVKALDDVTATIQGPSSVALVSTAVVYSYEHTSERLPVELQRLKLDALLLCAAGVHWVLFSTSWIPKDHKRYHLPSVLLLFRPLRLRVPEPFQLAPTS